MSRNTGLEYPQEDFEIQTSGAMAKHTPQWGTGKKFCLEAKFMYKNEKTIRKIFQKWAP